MKDILFIGSVVLVALVTVGCPGSSTTTTTTTPAPAPTFTPEETLAMACILGKTVSVTGTYYTDIGLPISVSREAEISEDLFKVKEEGGDELAEVDKDKSQVEKWWGDVFKISFDGRIGEGSLEVDCFEVSYKRGPFPGPSGNCMIEFKAIVCEDCTIEDATWKLTCDVAADGTGGQPKATGTWSVQ